MEKLEMRGDELYSIKETRIDGIDVSREIALLEEQKVMIDEKLKVYKNLKKQRDAAIISGRTTK